MRNDPHSDAKGAMTTPVDRNSNDEVFFTGLPPGPEHDRIVAEGTDFIVFQIDENTRVQEAGFNQGPYVLPNCPLQTLSLLDWVCFSDWCRVRAMSAEDAIGIYADAVDQWVAESNGSPRWREVVTFDWGDPEQTVVREQIIDGKDRPRS